MALAPGAALARSAGADESTQEPQTPDNAQGAGEATPSSADASATTGEPFVDNIVVTARKRSENLQEIPVSVTAFDSDSIEERSLRDLSDLSATLRDMISVFKVSATEAAEKSARENGAEARPDTGP
ncbi:MAG: hypothetical protein MI919_21425, partial [Holophagales bacterium]|nr:hypothetical protein [Holophagales bacterium]